MKVRASCRQRKMMSEWRQMLHHHLHPSFYPRNRRRCHGNATKTFPEWSQPYGSWSSPIIYSLIHHRHHSSHCFSFQTFFKIQILPLKCACKCLDCSDRCQSKSFCFPLANAGLLVTHLSSM